MSISEEWPEFVTPEAIARNTGVWPIWAPAPKPRLRWRHNAKCGWWSVTRPGTDAYVTVGSAEFNEPITERELVEMFV